MDLLKIKALLEKYYNGESSIEEEKILQEYFAGDNVSAELLADRDIFIYNSEQKANEDNLPDMSDQIWESIEKSEGIINISKHRKVTYWTLRIAAGIIVLIASYFLIDNIAEQNKDKYQLAEKDTFDDPEQAYEQAKQTLLYVSAMLNNGTEHLEPISKMNEGTEKLKPIASFNDGIKELNQIKKYQIANKYIKQ